MKVNKKKKGFTLIELIVVIAILGILAAVLIPKFAGFTAKAKQTQALVDAKQVATAIDSYYAEHEAYPTSSNEDEIAAMSGVAKAEFTGTLNAGGFTVTVGGHSAGRTGAGAVAVIS